MSALVLTADEVRELVREEVERALETHRTTLRAVTDHGPITVPEAARRLGVTVRDVQRRLKDGRLEAEHVGGVRLVRWPRSNGAR